MIDILPLPHSCVEHNGQFKITNSMNIYCEQNALFVADSLLLNIRKHFTAFSGRSIVIPSLPSMNACDYNGIILANNSSLKAEEYTINIKETRIIVEASAYSGFYYAYITIMQLFPKNIATNTLSLPSLTISDIPKYEWRGFALDEARHFFGKNEVLRLIEILATLKINKFHWHLTDDQGFRIQLDCYPILTDLGSKRNDSQVGGFYSKRFAGVGHQGYYTHEDIKEIVAFAAENCIEIIPELDLPSHTTAMLASIPELNCKDDKLPVATTFGNINNIICAGKSASYEILGKIIAEISELFPGRYLHLGGNNVALHNWHSCPNCQALMRANKLTTERELLGYFFNKLSAVAKTYGKTVIVYNSAITPSLDKDIIIQYCYADTITDTITEFASGRKLIVSPSNAYFFDYPYAIIPLKKVYQTPPAPIEFSDSTNSILGMEGILWSEWVYDREKLDFNIFPRMCAVADKAWATRFSPNSFNDFYSRLNALDGFNTEFKINYANNSDKHRHVFRRIRDRWQWLRNDQYTEVRRNRIK